MQSQSTPIYNNQTNNGHSQTDPLSNGHLNNGQLLKANDHERPSAITQPLSSETLQRIIDEPVSKTSVAEKRELKAVVESCEVRSRGESVAVKSFIETQEIKTLEIASAIESCEITVMQESPEMTCDQTVIENSFEPANKPLTRVSDEGS